MIVGMIDRSRTWWESRSGRTRIFVATPVSFVVLFLFHAAFFPRLTTADALLYSLMECVPVALLVAWATENELRRRRMADDE